MKDFYFCEQKSSNSLPPPKKNVPNRPAPPYGKPSSCIYFIFLLCIWSRWKPVDVHPVYENLLALTDSLWSDDVPFSFSDIDGWAIFFFKSEISCTSWKVSFTRQPTRSARAMQHMPFRCNLALDSRSRSQSVRKLVFLFLCHTDGVRDE